MQLQFANQRDRDLFVAGMSALISRCNSGDEVLVDAMLVRPMKLAEESVGGIRKFSRATSFSSFSMGLTPSSTNKSSETSGGRLTGFFGNSFKDKAVQEYDPVSTVDGDLGGVELPTTSTVPASSMSFKEPTSPNATLPKSPLSDSKPKTDLMNGNQEAML